MTPEPVEVVEASIAQLGGALRRGETTSELLVAGCLERIAAYDRAGPTLNSLVVLDPSALEQAAAADRRRARGESLGPLDGIPYTAKDSYSARGLTVAAGSPAFADLVAQRDSFAVERLRRAGAVLIGLTNMPPMANGGMQRGLYGRAESPYNADYLTAAFASGSSNGSGTATAASFAAVGLAEETWSSGRAPASNNGLCAYTPSRGVISIRGNWPLVPTMDVVVPHTRSMADLLVLLDVLVAPDEQARGDFWRAQPWFPIPPVQRLRPVSYAALAAPDPGAAREVLRGKRFGLPRMYANADPEAGSAPDGGIGGPTGRRIETRESVLDLLADLVGDLHSAGAHAVPCDFPVVSNYEGDRPGAPTIRTRGLVDPAYLLREVQDLSAWSWDDFLDANADPALRRLADVDGARIFPHPAGALPDRYHDFGDDIATFPAYAREHPLVPVSELTWVADGIRGLERTRERDFDDWLAANGFAAVLFPAVADVGPADADVDPRSAELAWRNGVWVANGNLVPRHLGIPTVTVPMGVMADIGMPVGVTLAGTPYADSELLAWAAAIEALRPRRVPPGRTPHLSRR